MFATRLCLRPCLVLVATNSIDGAGFAFAQAAPALRFEKLDVNEDGVLSGLELKAVADRDSDGDGRVTRGEFDGTDAKPSNVANADDEKKFHRLDVSEDEFLSGREMRGLERFDVDKDGRITKAEYLRGVASERSTPDVVPGLPKMPDPPAAPRESVAPPPLGKSAAAELANLVTKADAIFDGYDSNADDKLSGNEVLPNWKTYDADGDKRITREEFRTAVVPAYRAKPAAPSPSGPDAPTVPRAAVKSDLDPLIAAFQTGDIKPLTAALSERGRRGIDEVVLQFVVDTFRKEYGEIAPPGAADVKVIEASLKGEPLRETAATVKFARGAATLRTLQAGGKLDEVRIEAPLVDELDALRASRMAKADEREFVAKFSDFYGPQGERMLRLIVDADDEGAFACFHPDVQRQLGIEKVKAYFQRNREQMGDVDKITCLGVKAPPDENGRPSPDFVVEYDLSTAKQGKFKGLISFQFVDLKGHIVSLQLKKVVD